MKDNQICFKSENTEATSFLTSSSYNKFLHDLWQRLVDTLLTNSQELQVWQKVDRYGNIYWKAYDPVTGKSFMSGSEGDIRMWIEQLYQSSKYGKSDFGNW
ncbi:hypothetical protein [Tolypothrix sp. VBCCA 56010]|uniref:hypothetical protein n=1 Tax=Tolypothrix sp. VBCCA 56010 TaxID=3137731 RepID=UPI003D7D5EFD